MPVYLFGCSCVFAHVGIHSFVAVKSREREKERERERRREREGEREKRERREKEREKEREREDGEPECVSNSVGTRGTRSGAAQIRTH